MENQKTMTTTRIAEIQEAISGHNPLTIANECKSDYTNAERISYIENRINGFSAKQAHAFIIEDREFEYDF